jgi:ADP-ribose pyrophosphatase YjhB (NUDIX family)/GNAT superfamily N-acetyltransferase
MESAEVGGRVRQVCPACGFVLYRNPVPGVGVLIEVDGGIVMIRRGQPPFEGSWALPAGYIEEDESAEMAAVREAREETGLDVELGDLFGVYSFPEGPVHSGIIIFYLAHPVGGTLEAGDDAQAVAVFSPLDIPEQVAFRTHREVLARWREQARAAPRVVAGATAIRPAVSSDQATVQDLLGQIPGNQSLDLDQYWPAPRRHRVLPPIEVLVAEVEGVVVGFAAVSFVETLSGLRTLVNDIAVDPEHRRQGIGGALLEAAIQRAARRGATHVLVDTSRGDAATQEFLRACGFEAGGLASLRIR